MKQIKVKAWALVNQVKDGRNLYTIDKKTEQLYIFATLGYGMKLKKKNKLKGELHAVEIKIDPKWLKHKN